MLGTLPQLTPYSLTEPLTSFGEYLSICLRLLQHDSFKRSDLESHMKPSERACGHWRSCSRTHTSSPRFQILPLARTTVNFKKPKLSSLWTAQTGDLKQPEMHRRGVPKSGPLGAPSSLWQLNICTE